MNRLGSGKRVLVAVLGALTAPCPLGTSLFAALASATRRAILARLAEGEANVNELAEPFALTLPTISKHIKVLERAGLIVRSHRAQYRPCALDPAPLAEIARWFLRTR